MKTIRNDDVNGYKIDFATNTLTLNYKFNKALSDFGSPEYLRYKAIMEDFPALRVVVKAGRTIETTRENKRLSYENMEKHIEAYENAEELKEVFKTVKALSKPCASPYKYVRDWFEAQFPDYKKTITLQNSKLTTVPIKPKDNKEYKQKLSLAG